MNHKDIDYKEEHQNIRKKIWMDVYVAYVRADNSINRDGAASWADIALKRFDERFKEPESNDKNNHDQQ